MIERRKYPRQRILIYDDDQCYTELLEYHLNQAGYKTFAVDNEEDCFLALKKDFYKILLLDNVLPDKKGIDIIGDIQEISPATKIIIITAYANNKDKMYALNHCSGFTTKNSNSSEIILKIKSVLAQG